MTNILIPTDFTAASLKPLCRLLKNDESLKCNVILFHAFCMPQSAFDLLGTESREPLGEVMNEPFRIACKQLKDQFSSRVGKVMVRCLTGDTTALFRNFIDANDIDLIYCPEEFQFVKLHKRSLDPRSLFEKCGIPMYKPQGAVKAVYVNENMPSFELSTS